MRKFTLLTLFGIAACGGDPTGPDSVSCDTALQLAETVQRVQAHDPQNAYVRMSNGDIFATLTCSKLRDIITFRFTNQGLQSLEGLQYMVSLEAVIVGGNNVTDLTPLTSLQFLEGVSLTNNRKLSNITPLVNNTALGWGDVVGLQGTAVSCGDIARLESQNITVKSDC